MTSKTEKVEDDLARKLLDVIIQSQQAFILKGDPQPALGVLLESVLNLTESEYGFVGENLGQSDEKLRFRNRAILDLSTSQLTDADASHETELQDDAVDLDRSVGSILASGKAVNFDQRSELLQTAWLPENHPRIHTLIYLPVSAGQNLIGIIGLANRKNGYTDFDVKRIKPLLEASAHLLMVSRERYLREKIEQEHVSNQKISQAVLETALDCIIGMDQYGCIAEFNPAAEATFGWLKSEVIGKKLADTIIPEKLRSAHDAGLDNFMKTGEGPVLGKRIEVTAIRRGQGEFPVELAVISHELRGRPFFTAHLRDISERRKSEDALSKARELAESASRAKSSFVATISHEIRTPINAIMGAIGLLGSTNVGAQNQGFLETAQTSAKALLEIVDGVLDFSRIEAGETALESEQIRTAEFLDEILDLLSGAAAENGVQLGCLCHSGVPGELKFDVGKVRQVLLNLVGNSIKFSPAGEVRIDLEVESNRLRFSVSDSGIGISEEDCARVFDEFVQVGCAREYRGTGLGLAICKRLVDLMSGEIGVDSAVGAGSKFWFTLPYNFEILPSGFGKAKTFRRVLIVGDGGFYEELLIDQLNAWGVGYFTAGNFADAQECLSQPDDIDAVFLLSANTAAKAWLVGAEKLSTQCQMHSLPMVLFAEVGSECAKCLQGKLNLTSVIGLPIPLVSLRHSLEIRDSERIVESNLVSSKALDKTPRTKIRVLLAEDSQSNRLVMAEVLRRCGFDVDVAGNGAEALASVELFPYDVVLMDIDMPEMSGIEATHAIRRLHSAVSEVPIIAITAHAAADDKDRFLSEGMNDYVCKPVDRNVLDSIIRRWARDPLQDSVGAGQQPNPGDKAEGDDVLVDEQSLQQLAEDTSPELLPKMVAVFVRELQSRALAIDRGLKDGDENKLKAEAHALKSSAATYGATAVRAQALLMEEGFENNDEDRTITAARKLLDLVEPTARSMKSRFNLD